MTELELEEFYNKRFKPHIKGSSDKAYSKLRGAVFVDEIDPEIILIKWNEYMDMCRKEERQSKFIQDTHNWLNDKGWLNDYKIKDTKTRSFLSKWLEGLKYLFA